jgi:serine/threonine protein phosphatase PrpC
MEELLDELVAKDTTAGLGCDNMTAILIKIK